MGISINLFNAITDPVSVPIKSVDGTMALLPMTAEIEAEYGKKGGVKFKGGSRTGDDYVALMDVDPVIQLRAHKWLFRELVKGWEIEAEDANGEKAGNIEFTAANRDKIAGIGEVVNEVIKEAKRLAGTLREDDEKNSES